MSATVPHVIALLATYNEERFIAACLEHLFRQNVFVHLIDNCSTDQTVTIAERYLGRGLVGIEGFPRVGIYSWRPLLERKQQLANSLDADWFMHVDADEIRLPPPSTRSLAHAFAEVERQGYNAVNFQEFTFVPTREAPDHDHPHFQDTMRWYYPFSPSAKPHQVKAWKRQASGAVELASSGGHEVQFPGVRVWPQWFPMRHYLFLSVLHAVRKYVNRRYDPVEVESGLHRLRAKLRPAMIQLPSQAELRRYRSDKDLDASRPRAQHFLFDEAWISQQLAAAGRTPEN
jgi:hypothetical protein